MGGTLNRLSGLNTDLVDLADESQKLAHDISSTGFPKHLKILSFEKEANLKRYDNDESGMDAYHKLFELHIQDPLHLRLTCLHVLLSLWRVTAMTSDHIPEMYAGNILQTFFQVAERIFELRINSVRLSTNVDLKEFEETAAQTFKLVIENASGIISKDDFIIVSAKTLLYTQPPYFTQLHSDSLKCQILGILCRTVMYECVPLTQSSLHNLITYTSTLCFREPVLSILSHLVARTKKSIKYEVTNARKRRKTESVEIESLEQICGWNKNRHLEEANVSLAIKETFLDYFSNAARCLSEEVRLAEEEEFSITVIANTIRAICLHEIDTKSVLSETIVHFAWLLLLPSFSLAIQQNNPIHAVTGFCDNFKVSAEAFFSIEKGSESAFDKSWLSRMYFSEEIHLSCVKGLLAMASGIPGELHGYIVEALFHYTSESATMNLVKAETWRLHSLLYFNDAADMRKITETLSVRFRFGSSPSSENEDEDNNLLITRSIGFAGATVRTCALKSLHRLVRHGVIKEFGFEEEPMLADVLKCLGSRLQIAKSFDSVILPCLTISCGADDTVESKIINRNSILFVEEATSFIELKDNGIILTLIAAFEHVGRTADEEVLGSILLGLAKCFAVSNLVVKYSVHTAIKSLAKARGNTVFEMISPFLSIISMFLIERAHIPGLMKEFASLLSMSLKDFVEITLEFTLPYLVIEQKGEMISRLATSVLHTHISVLCVKEIHHILSAIFMLDPKTMAPSIRFLIDLVGGQSITMISLIKSDALNLVRKLAIELGDPSEARRVKARNALEIVCGQMSSNGEKMSDFDSLSEFLRGHFLGMLSFINENIYDVRHRNTRAKKLKIVKSLDELIIIIGPRLYSMVSQVVATLQTTLERPFLRMVSLNVWFTLIKTLGVGNIGPILNQITAILLKYDADYSSEERRLLLKICEYLFIQNAVALNRFFDELCPFPESSQFDLIRKSIERYRATVPILERLRAVAKGVSNENPDVTKGSLSELQFILTKHQTYLQTEMLADTVSETINDTIRCLLETCKRYNGSRPDIQLACCECIGILGAVDPARVDINIASDKEVQLDIFASSDSTIRFACRLVEKQLAPAFRSAQSTKAQDHISYAIQEVLRFCGFTSELVQGEKDSSDKRIDSRVVGSMTHGKKSRLMMIWNGFPRIVIEVIQPLLSSQYRSNSAVTKAELYPIYQYRPGYKEWLQAWVVDLLLRINGEDARRLLLACKTVAEQNINVALYLLPHLVLQTLTTGDAEQLTQVQNELLAVLKDNESLEVGDSSDFDSRHLCCQTIFSLVDHLTLWIRLRRQDLGKKKAINARRSGKFLNVDDVDDLDAQRSKVEKLLLQIPQDLMANASYRCKAYARALMHFEQYIRAERKRRGDQDMQSLYAHLQKIYSHLDEPDSMDGIATLFLSPSLEQQILEHESAGRWTAAQTCYEISVQRNPDKLGLHIGLINCLKNLGHFETMLNHINGIISRYSEWEPILRSHSIEACWRLGSWSLLEESIHQPHESRFEVSIGKLLLAARDNKEEVFVKELKDTREKLMAPLAAASMESYLRGYDLTLKLHMLYEIESVFTFQKSYGNAEELLKSWDSRLKITVSSLKVREPVLNLRRILLNDLGIIQLDTRDREIESGRIWLQTAKVMRKAGHIEPAFSAILHAVQLNAPGVIIEKAKWLTEKGQSYKAIQELQFAMKMQKNVAKVGSPASILERQGSIISDISRAGSEIFILARDNQLDVKSAAFIEAKSALLLARRMDENGIGNATVISEMYTAVTSLQPEWEKAYFFLGRFYNKLLDTDKNLTSKRSSINPSTINYYVCKNYARALTYGTQFIYQTLPRLLTLWLESGTQQAKKSDSNEVNTIFGQINRLIKRLIDKIPSYQFLTALPQIISRLCHINRQVHAVLELIILRVLQSYPHQTLWHLVSVSKSRYKVRAARCNAILDKAKSDPQILAHSPKLKSLVMDGQKLTDELLNLCNFQIKGRETMLNMSKDFGTLKLLAPSSMILPLQSTLNVTLPTDNSTLTSHNPFPIEAPTFKKFYDEIEVMNSLQKPRKIQVLGSNGKCFNFLLKPKDDLRKDARLMEFNSLINRLLKKDAESRRRNLHVRTYAVIPLNEECGIIEWVENTAGFRNILVKNYKSKSIGVQPQDVKMLLDQKTPAVDEIFVKQVLPRLGDRHGENILFDELTGACVHVDLNCLFEKGATFERPEVVPFRLTHNMVDAFGISGTEGALLICGTMKLSGHYSGVFRKACENSLRVLRANRESLVAVLETFIHDPLCEWSRRSSSVKGSFRDGTGEIENEEALKHLRTIDSKLKGVTKTGFQLGVEGQVQDLIAEATDPKNLAVMYIESMTISVAMAALLPPMNKGMVALNRDLFKKSFNLAALRIPSSSCTEAMQRLEGTRLDVPRLPSIVEDPAAPSLRPTRLLLLDPAVATADNFESLPAGVQEFATSVGAEPSQYTLSLGYDYWTADQILRSILPDELEVPGSFEMIGHIAHLNLRDQYLPYKSIIGEVLLDKNKYIRTVVNKTDSIDHTFRFFKMELLAGEDQMIAEIKESNCRFKVDFSAVYWNSRLQGEHDRIVRTFNKNDLVCDVFGGVGPFAVPAAKNVGCLVFSNDLNPVSYKYLIENIALNKVAHLVKGYNSDGREFVRTSLEDLNNEAVIKELLGKAPPKKEKRLKNKDASGMAKTPAPVEELPTLPKYAEPGFKMFSQYVMNLPGTAIEFLGIGSSGLYSFHGLLYKYKSLIPDDHPMPIVHCHCFAHKVEEKEEDVVKRAESYLGAKIGDNLIKIVKVRGVSPKKEMLCITFRLPREVVFAEPKAR
ncbi:serine/threonine-protein kinase M1 [Dinochytrium kinnereticum]|nr:serine/threonine-protein kinase M1 [Dinochytrium kinnereticum]